MMMKRMRVIRVRIRIMMITEGTRKLTKTRRNFQATTHKLC